VTINKLMCFIKLNLALGTVSHLNSALESDFRVRLRNIIATMRLVDEDLHVLWRNLHYAATNSEVVKLGVSVTLAIADNECAWHGDRHEWFVTRKDTDFTLGRRDNDFVDIPINQGATESDKFHIH
jgi:hypothetical protein